ncbi:AraC family transcriptional regulator [Massilia sp. 9096]|uniref:AraC family transcriptional regulator n=1 Tax=Massilia sp. 9096 TaxID=1500894 RepID=UPI0005682FD7|nr:AraC family transcriptional regulator [Massilia sp. 9096]
MDPLSDLLSTLKPNDYMFRGIDMAGAWSLQFPANDGLGCYAVISGECWLAMEGDAAPIRLGPGDCVLLAKGKPFRFASDLDLPAIDAVGFVTSAVAGGIASMHGGGEVTGVGGFFHFPEKDAGDLLHALPEVILINNPSNKAALRFSMELLMQELRDMQSGGHLVAIHLAQMALVLALRAYLGRAPALRQGWLAAVADKQLGKAITAIHKNPGCGWTLQTLAELACMSRATFASRFKTTVGVAPIEYVLRWRMLVAGERLASGARDSIGAIALSLGYATESAFSAAFKRTMGCSPDAYRRRARSAPTA